MKPITIINTFKSVVFDNQRKPIVICDIDYTFLQPKHSYKYYYDMLKPKFLNEVEHDEITKNILDAAINYGFVRQTDQEGFSMMLEKINQLEGKLIFLTARASVSHMKTVNDLKTCGLENWADFAIHYTNNQINKADYISSNNLLDGYNHFIYIDDNVGYLNSASRLYPSMDCYYFKCNL